MDPSAPSYALITESGRDPPEKSIEYSIDCWKNPYDLRPAAKLILQAITERKPDIVLFGENHYMFSHTALLHLLLEQLIETGKHFALGLECPHNLWAHIVENKMKTKLPPALRASRSGHGFDRDGRLALIACAAFFSQAGAPGANHRLINFCLRSEIPAIFMDAARNTIKSKENSLYPSDTVTQNAMKDHFEQITNNDAAGSICMTDADKIAIRNQIMARNMMDYIGANDKPLMILKTGASHVMGVLPRDKYEYSLHHVLRAAGKSVLCVLPTIGGRDFRPQALPAEARPFLEDIVVIHGLSKRSYSQKPDLAAHFEPYVLQKIYEASGQNPKSYKSINPSDHSIDPALRAAYQRQARQELEQIIADYKKGTFDMAGTTPEFSQ